MSPRGQVLHWAAQRFSAMVLAVCVLVHLVTLIYAVRGGLSAAEILGRTRGNLGWGIFYTVFVVAAAIHAPIGLRAILAEWFGWRGAALGAAMGIAMLVVLGLGLRAVWAVIG